LREFHAVTAVFPKWGVYQQNQHAWFIFDLIRISGRITKAACHANCERNMPVPFSRALEERNNAVDQEHRRSCGLGKFQKRQRPAARVDVEQCIRRTWTGKAAP